MILVLCAVLSFALPKLQPGVRPLSQHHTETGPRFWELIAHYVGQEEPWSCAVASLADVLNAAKASRLLTQDDKLITHKRLLKDIWKDKARGVSLDELQSMCQEALATYHIKGRCEAMHASAQMPYQDVLTEMEKGAKTYVIANFLQKTFTGDADVGHYSPVGAWNSVAHEVLVLDVDRTWYEPYWVSEERFLQGLLTEDKSVHKMRGLLVVRENV